MILNRTLTLLLQRLHGRYIYTRRYHPDLTRTSEVIDSHRDGFHFESQLCPLHQWHFPIHESHQLAFNGQR